MRAKARKRPKRLRRSTGVRTGTLLLLIASVVAAGYVFSARAAVEPAANAAPIKVAREYDTIMLPIPTRSVARGERLEDVPFVKMRWPKSRLSAEYVTEIAALDQAVAASSLPANLPVPRAALRREGTDGNAVVERIPEGSRAITVRVDAESAVEGWARSGNFVDVIVLRRASEASVGLEAKVIAENVKILSAGRSTEPLVAEASAPRAPATVTLLVSQEDALKIKTAASVGKLTFALRGAGDESPTRAKRMSQKQLLEGARTLVPRRTAYRGRAKGPDGRTYVLGSDSRWVRTAESEYPGSARRER